MNDEPPSEQPKLDQRSLDQCFADKPYLRGRLLEIADLIDTLVAQGCTADQAEAKAIEQIRKLGNGILTEWAQKAEAAAVAKARAQDLKLHLCRKKSTDLAHHLRASYGARATVAPRPTWSSKATFLSPGQNKCPSTTGWNCPPSSVRSRTLAHAKASGGVQHQAPKRPVQTLITEMDGTMLPMVTTKTGPGLDGRKAKQLFWREARLCLARPLDAVDAVYGATFGTAQMAALLWRKVGEAAGLGPQSRVHGLGDGATWIVNHFQEQFGSGADSRATYTVDFHHVSDYLAAAAKVVAPERNKDWLHQQQGWLRQNCVSEVLRALAPHLEPEPPGQKEEEKGPVRSAHGYISERKQYLNYAGALAEGLPIGSGEVEGGHRHVLQKRLKIPGAWWLEGNAERMLQLRTVRANGDWIKYWTELAKNRPTLLTAPRCGRGSHFNLRFGRSSAILNPNVIKLLSWFRHFPVGVSRTLFLSASLLVGFSLETRAQPVAFPDPNLEMAVRNALSIGPPTVIDRSNLLTLTSFTADQLGIRTLTGLEFATNLTYIEIRGNYNQPGLTNISALASLRNLTYLDVSFNQITNAAAVAGLTNLIHLDLGGNVGVNNLGIRDTAYLANLKRLQWLSLFYLGVQDLGGLAGPTALTNLNVSYNYTATNAGAFNALTNLAELYATDIGLSDIEFVSRMPQLDRLDFGGNHVASLTPALGRNLVALWAYSNPLTNALLVTNFTALGLLHLDNSSLTNVSSLASLTALHELSLDNNPGITSLSFLNALTNLTYLSIGQLPLTSLTALSGLTNLTELHLHDDTALNSIAPLTGLTNLNNLDLNNCPLLDFTVVTNFVNLNYLQLDNDGLQAAPFALNLPNLYSLHMNGDLCTSLDWLAGTGLGELQFYGNRLGDISALLPMTSINYIDLRNNYLDLSPDSLAWQVITNLQAVHTGQNYNPVDYLPQSRSTALTIFDRPEPQCVAVGGTGYFAIAATTTAGTLRYQWQFNNRDLPGQTNNVLWLANVTSNQAGFYGVLLQDDQGGLLSAQAPLHVGDPNCGQTIFIQQQPVNLVAALGDDVTFSVVATTTLTNLYYQWQFNGTNLAGETLSTHAINPVTPNDAGFYQVILTDDGSNVVASALVELRIVDLVAFPDPALSSQVYQALNLAPGTPIHLSDLDALNSLYIGNYGNGPVITDLSGLQYARNLQNLDLSNQSVTNADLLAWNIQLSYLNLDNCGLQDASFISNLFNLYDLVLSDNQIHEIPRMDALVNTLQYLQIDRNGSLVELPRLGVLTNLFQLSLHSDSVPDIMFVSQMTQLTSLDVGGDWMFDQFRNTISDISPLHGKTNLNWLSLSWDQVTNAPLVAQFTNMEHLFLSGDFFSNLDIITNMPRLVELSINYSQVTNLAVLALHWQMQSLDVSYIAATNLTPVAGLTNLNTLWAGGNHAGSASPVAALTSLRTLGYEQNGVSNLSPIVALTNLNFLGLENNLIPGIATLAGRTNLTSLYLSGNLIHDLSPLAGDTNLNWLSLSANGFTNLVPLANLTGLVYLVLQSNHIRDITPLGGLTNLHYGLDVSANEIRDMSPLTNLHTLTSLQIYQNQLTWLPSLLGLTGITGIDFWGNQLTNAAGASGMTQLTYLGLSRNNFSTIQGLSNLPNLSSLELFTNHLTDVSGLAGLTSLHYLYLFDNDLQSIHALTNLINLNYTDLTYNLLDTNLNSTAMLDVAILQSQNTGVNYLPQKTFSSTAITLLSPVALPGNQFRFMVQSSPGVTIRIQTSTNLINWSSTDFVTNTTGTASYTDTVTTASQKYYRAQSQ